MAEVSRAHASRQDLESHLGAHWTVGAGGREPCFVGKTPLLPGGRASALLQGLLTSADPKVGLGAHRLQELSKGFGAMLVL